MPATDTPNPKTTQPQIGYVRPNPPPLSVLVRVMVSRITCIVRILKNAPFTPQGIHIILNHFVY